MIYENFTTRVSLDKEELLNILEVICIGFRIRTPDTDSGYKPRIRLGSALSDCSYYYHYYYYFIMTVAVVVVIIIIIINVRW